MHNSATYICLCPATMDGSCLHRCWRRMLSSNPAAGRWSGLVRMTCILRVSSCRNRTWLMIITRRTLSHTHAYIQVGSLLASGIKASQTSCSWMFWEHGFAKGHALTLCLEQCSLSLSFSLCLSLALYLIIVVPCSHLWLFCLPNLQLRTRIAAIKALCDQQKGWVRWLGPGIVIHIYIHMNNLGWHAHPAFSPTSGSLLLPNDDILRRDKYEKQVKLYWVELKIGGRKLMLGYV